MDDLHVWQELVETKDVVKVVDTAGPLGVHWLIVTDWTGKGMGISDFVEIVILRYDH